MTRRELYRGIEIINGEAVVKVAEDDLKGYVEGAVSDFSREISSELPKIIQDAGITFGLKDMPEVIDGRLVFAQGIPPEDGKDGQIIVNAASLREHGEQEDSDAVSVDPRIKNIIPNVTRNEIIAEKIAPTSGKPGKNIFGEKVEAKPGELKAFRLGERVEILNKDTLVAACDGAVRVGEDGSISVETEWVIEGDVDISTGHIEFCGEKLTITGSVCAGFTVEAAKDLVIEGQVNDDAIILAGGHIEIAGIIRARNTIIKAGQGMKCSAVEYARIFSGGDVRIEDYLLDARCQIEGSLEVSGGKGMIVGGTIEVGGSLTAETAGTPANVPTVMAAGINPLLERHYEALVKEQEKHAGKLADIRKGLIKLKKMEDADGSLNSGKQTIKQTLKKAAMTVVSAMDANKSRIKALEADLGDMESASVTILQKAYPGCRILIDKASLVLDRPVERVCFVFRQGEIVIHKLVAAEEEPEGK